MWCSNPETQNREIELLYSLSQCIFCGSCAKVCPDGAFTRKGETIRLNRDLCTGCGRCAEECPTGAASMAGYPITMEDALKELEADIVFFRNSGGGVTLSGGEPALHPTFSDELIQGLRKRSIHTAIETCGFAPWDDIWTTTQHADLVLYDIKAIDPALHKACTGADNELILDNAVKLVQLKDVIFRLPVIPGYTATDENLSDIAEFITDLGTGNEVHLLPYHGFGSGKYRSLGMNYTLEGKEPPSNEEMDQYESFFSEQRIRVTTYR